MIKFKTSAKEDAKDLKDLKFENSMTWLQLGVDLESRRLHLDMEVDSTMATLVIRSLVKMSEVSNEPIEMYFSSYGGDAYACLSIYDAIRACPAPITIFASGKIMSAGAIIFLASDRRFAAPNTTFMIHSVSSGTEGTIKDQEIDVAEGKRLNNIMLNILAERTKMNLKWWSKQILSHDKYLDVETASQYGIVGSVVKKLEKVVVKPKVKKKKLTKKSKRK